MEENQLSGIQETQQETLRPRARIMRTIGDELISNDVTAVIELVKNSFDADATKVLLRIVGPSSENGYIELIDNGNGMSPHTVTTAWMQPATDFKKRNPRSEQFKRRVLGDKGIGRFAASRLADTLEIVTKQLSAESEVVAFFDWTQFDDDEKFLEDVKVHWRTREPIEISPDGALAMLYANETEPIEEDQLKKGTVLRLVGLRSTWNERDIRALRRGLGRLISPYFDQNPVEKFEIRLELPDSGDKDDYVKPPEIVKKPHYEFHGTIDADGNHVLRYSAKEDSEKVVRTGKYPIPGVEKPRCGPFEFKLRVWDRDTEALQEFIRDDFKVREVRAVLDEVAGISIYRDGFRVLPYGEPKLDWLRLDLRSRLDPSLRLANNQVVGYITIGKDENPDLKDQSNREGLMDNEAFEDLKFLILAILRPFETFRFELRKQARDDKESPLPTPRKVDTLDGLFNGFKLDKVSELVKKNHPGDYELISALQETEKEFEGNVKRIQEVLSRFVKLSTLGQLVDIVLHEGRTPLAKIATEVGISQKKIKKLKGYEREILQPYSNSFQTILEQQKLVSHVIRKVEPFGGRKRAVPKNYVIEELIAQAVDVLKQPVKETNVRVDLPSTKTEWVVEKAEIQQIIINMLHNSVYWLQTEQKENREVAIEVESFGEYFELTFSDSGPGVHELDRYRIFDPYFSTRPDGIGLGLSIVGEIVTDYYGGKLELLEDGPLKGATFRVTISRRV